MYKLIIKKPNLKENNMRKLNTIQKRNNLNTVYAMDEAGVGNASHSYIVAGGDSVLEDAAPVLCELKFQHGPRNDANSIHGILDTDLLEIVRDRLIGFQSGEFACRENALALTKLEECLMWMNRRVEDRAERKVLGTMEK